MSLRRFVQYNSVDLRGRLAETDSFPPFLNVALYVSGRNFMHVATLRYARHNVALYSWKAIRNPMPTDDVERQWPFPESPFTAVGYKPVYTKETWINEVRHTGGARNRQWDCETFCFDVVSVFSSKIMKCNSGSSSCMGAEASVTWIWLHCWMSRYCFEVWECFFSFEGCEWTIATPLT